MNVTLAVSLMCRLLSVSYLLLIQQTFTEHYEVHSIFVKY